MGLAGILNVPETEQDFLTWGFKNAELHLRIETRLQGLGVSLVPYILDPIPLFDTDGWLARHQQAHDDFNGVLNISGADLSTVDFKNREELEAWILLHEQEHLLANQILGI